jgi:hypothetical protein
MASDHSQAMTSYTLTAEDYCNALRLHMRRAWASKASSNIFAAGVLIAIASAPLFGFNLILTVIGVAGIGSLVGVAAWAFIISYVYIPRKARKVFNEQKAMQYPAKMSWDNRAFTVTSSLGSSIIPWSDYYGWSADRSIILLRLSSVLFHMVPCRALSQEQARDLFYRLELSGLRRI